MSQEFLTVSELNNFIRDVLNSGFPRALWICGEIQGYNRGKDKKHVFFELCEKDPVTHEIIARTALVIFATARPKIDIILMKSENAFVLKDDIEVKFLCKVDFYPGHGQIRLIVESIDPIYTLGKIAQDRQRLIALMKQKGVLDQNKRLSLARVPLHIGLITSYDSAAYHDFIDELKRSSYAFKVFVVNAVMQGKNTEASVVKAIQSLNAMESLDLIVIIRGGGSIADLSCFDSQIIAEAIAKSRLPVISGIGHEINTTVTDLAAHTFAKTPTAVAQLLVFRVEEFLLHLNDRNEELLRMAEDYIKTQQTRLKDNAKALKEKTLELVKAHQQKLVRLAEALKRSPVVRLKESRAKLASYAKLIEMADPKNTLKRGFSITRTLEGKLVRTVANAKGQKSLVTFLIDGKLASDIIKSSEEQYVQ